MSISKTIVPYIRNEIVSLEFVNRNKFHLEDFTRSRILTFNIVFIFILRKSVKSLQLGLLHDKNWQNDNRGWKISIFSVFHDLVKSYQHPWNQKMNSHYLPLLGLLQKHISLNLARTKCLALFVTAMLKCRTVNLALCM